MDLIAANLEPLLPWRVIYSYERGVAWRWGVNPRPLNPGIHLRIPLRDSIEKTNAAEEVRNLPTQSVVTRDGKAVVFSVNFGFIVDDPVKYFCGVQDFDASVEALAMTHLAKRVRSMDYTELTGLNEDLRNGLDELEKSLRSTLTTKLKEWGARCTQVGFTDFVESGAQVRLFQDPART